MLQFRILVVRVKDGNGYLAQTGRFSFWGRTRMEAIAELLAVIEATHKTTKLFGN